MHYLFRYVCILNVFFYTCIWTILSNKEFIIIIIIISNFKAEIGNTDLLSLFDLNSLADPNINYNNNNNNFFISDISPYTQ